MLQKHLKAKVTATTRKRRRSVGGRARLVRNSQAERSMLRTTGIATCASYAAFDGLSRTLTPSSRFLYTLSQAVEKYISDMVCLLHRRRLSTSFKVSSGSVQGNVQCPIKHKGSENCLEGGTSSSASNEITSRGPKGRR